MKYLTRDCRPYATQITTGVSMTTLLSVKIFAFLTKIGVARKAEGNRGRLLVHGFKELFVILGSTHFVLQKFHRLNRTQL